MERIEELRYYGHHDVLNSGARSDEYCVLYHSITLASFLQVSLPRPRRVLDLCSNLDHDFIAFHIFTVDFSSNVIGLRLHFLHHILVDYCRPGYPLVEYFSLISLSLWSPISLRAADRL